MLTLMGIRRLRWGSSEEFKQTTGEMRRSSQAVSVADGEAGKDCVPADRRRTAERPGRLNSYLRGRLREAAQGSRGVGLAWPWCGDVLGKTRTG